MSRAVRGVRHMTTDTAMAIHTFMRTLRFCTVNGKARRGRPRPLTLDQIMALE